MDTYELFSSDQPVTTPDQDVLGYSTFARNLAKAILKIPAPQGFVVAINGDWGLGKSSIIALMLHFLETETDESEKPLVVQFSPWMFSGQENLLRHFLEQLQTALLKDEWWKGRGLLLRRKLNAFSNKLSDAPMVGEYAKAAHRLSSGPDVQALKEEIAEELAKHGRRIIVVIDDIDRLHRDEILQLFRVIKATANFPNVVYLVAFDKKVVSAALSSEKEGWDGASWLEKIVQVSFDIPLPGEVKIQELFVSKLNELAEDYPEDQFSQHRWHNLYTEGIQHFLKTPRHVIRLINALSLTLPPIIKEVNVGDFVALETLRLFCPLAYDTIRRNKDYFITTIRGWGEGKTQEDRKREFHQGWLSQIAETDQEAVNEMVNALFPQLEDSLHWSPTEGTEVEWSKRVYEI